MVEMKVKNWSEVQKLADWKESKGGNKYLVFKIRDNMLLYEEHIRKHFAGKCGKVVDRDDEFVKLEYKTGKSMWWLEKVLTTCR